MNMKKIITIVVIVILIAVFSLQINNFIRQLGQIDNRDWDVQWLKQYIFTNIEPARVYNYHSYVGNPPSGVRAVREMVFYLEIPKDDIGLALKTKKRDGETLEPVNDPKTESSVIRCINQKLEHLRHSFKLVITGQEAAFHLSSLPKKLYAFTRIDPESGESFVIIGQSENGARNLIVYAQGIDFSK